MISTRPLATQPSELDGARHADRHGVVLGIDNLVFIAICLGKTARASALDARRIGIGLSLIFRIALLFTISSIIKLTTPVLTINDMAFPRAT